MKNEKKKNIYFDNASTTKPSKELVDYLFKNLSENKNENINEFFANPSSTHSLGVKAKDEIYKVRKQIAKILSNKYKKISPDEIFFCASATEANNIAINSIKKHNNFLNNKLALYSEIDHPSIVMTYKNLKDSFSKGDENFNSIPFNPKIIKTNFGRIDTNIYEEYFLNDGTFSNVEIISLSEINSETGGVNDINTFINNFENFKNENNIEGKTLIHVDGTGGFLRKKFIKDFYENKTATNDLPVDSKKNFSNDTLQQKSALNENSTENLTNNLSDNLTGGLSKEKNSLIEDLDFSKIDFYTFSPHKINMLKGLGAFYFNGGSKRFKSLGLKPLICGGGQEGELRSGTENTFAILAFGHLLKIYENEGLQYKLTSEDIREFILTINGATNTNIRNEEIKINADNLNEAGESSKVNKADKVDKSGKVDKSCMDDNSAETKISEKLNKVVILDEVVKEEKTSLFSKTEKFNELKAGIKNFHIVQDFLAKSENVNCTEKLFSPLTLNLITPYPSEVFVNLMSDKGVFLSKTSACSSKDTNTSKAILSLGLSIEEAKRTVRISFGKDNTKEELKEFIEIIKTL